MAIEKIPARKNGNGEHPAETAPPATDMVLIGCKLPNGLILQCCEQIEVTEQMNAGYRTVKVWVKSGPKYKINGNAQFRVGDAARNMTQLIYGAAFTSVPKEFWERWSEQNADADYLKNGHVFAVPSLDGANAEARNREALRTGTEPIDPDGDPRGIKSISTAPEMNGRAR